MSMSCSCTLSACHDISCRSYTPPSLRISLIPDFWLLPSGKNCSPSFGLFLTSRHKYMVQFTPCNCSTACLHCSSAAAIQSKLPVSPLLQPVEFPSKFVHLGLDSQVRHKFIWIIHPVRVSDSSDSIASMLCLIFSFVRTLLYVQSLFSKFLWAELYLRGTPFSSTILNIILSGIQFHFARRRDAVIHNTFRQLVNNYWSSQARFTEE